MVRGSDGVGAKMTGDGGRDGAGMGQGYLLCFLVCGIVS